MEKETNEPYLLLQDINKRSDCSVIIFRDFEEITNKGKDGDYLFDYGHMTKKSAKLYTNWLVDRLEETPKIADAMDLRQPIEENKPLLSTRPTTVR